MLEYLIFVISVCTIWMVIVSRCYEEKKRISSAFESQVTWMLQYKKLRIHIGKELHLVLLD